MTQENQHDADAPLPWAQKVACSSHAAPTIIPLELGQPSLTHTPSKTPSKTCLIPLTKGYEAIIDADDAARVLAFGKWTALVGGRRSGNLRVYAYNKRGGKVTLLHRFLLSAPAHLTVDHANGNSLDNRKENLRLATYSENNANQRKRPNGTSRFKGVSLNHDRWRVRISLAGVEVAIGTFMHEEDAARAYDAAALVLHGQFALLNFPQEREALNG